MRNTALEKEILDCTDSKFNDLALKIFHFQATNCVVYAKWLQYCGISAHSVQHTAQIPFLPISLFKSHKVLVDGLPEENALVFESSSTTGTGVSKHIVPYPDWYEAVFQRIFREQYGPELQFRIIALLPSYLERPNSSLVYMVQKLAEGNHGVFIKDDLHLAMQQLAQNEDQQQPTLLLGVTYALLDLAEQYHGAPLKYTTMMETGGMKGRRQELTRSEVHQTLTRAFGLGAIHSEYGMTELMSQAYAKVGGFFECPMTMRVSIADNTDPFAWFGSGKTGRICITDLANLYSCAFIATDDLGKLHDNGSFEVMGRMDFSDTRGCNLMWG